ncbi:MAG: hypothetical protein KAS53_08210 [Candidatus Cloacimonetes bacterium]|nr:hypothetical protein [Candidatus Cloacimonadota bacterium]
MEKDSKAFGIITRSLLKLEPINIFLDNAKEHGHTVEHLIISYEDEIDPSVLRSLQQECHVTAVKRGNAPILDSFLMKLGLTKDEIRTILGTPYKERYGMVSYGTSRNYVLIATLMLGINYLYFFDTDIYPKILTEFHNGKHNFINIDFVGSHSKYLREKNVILTTSDYTGYYIIPKMNFPYLMELLRGVQKEDRFYYISSVDTPVTRNTHSKNIFDTQKALGGNIALDLSKIDIIPPFFSTTLILDGECFLGRGEDTLFGPEIHGSGRCVDIDLLIFHNCFGDFPNKPEITKQKNLDRFYYACMGWVIRNPFLNWLREKYAISTEDINIEKRYESLLIGSKSAAEYFKDERFLKLPETFQLSYQKLESDIKQFEELMSAWKKLRRLLNKE